MTEQVGQRVSTVLSGDTEQISGRDAHAMTIAAGSAVAEAVRTTLGPRGMDKMLVTDSGDVVVTNDGVTVLEEMAVDHPAADMIVDIARTQEAEVGDGTTSAVVLAGALLDSAEDLMDQGLHSSTIVEGYRLAREVAIATLDDVSIPISPDSTALLEEIAGTAMAGKAAETGASVLAPAVVEAVQRTLVGGQPDLDAITVKSFHGRPVADSRLLDGLMVDREPDHGGMPTTLADAEILVYDGELELTEAGRDVTVDVSDPSQLAAFQDRDGEELMAMAEAIIAADVDILFASGTIDDRVQGRLAEEGLLSAQNLRDEDIENLVTATGAARVTDFSTVSADDLGYAGRVRQELIRGKYGVKSAEPEKSIVLSDLDTGTAATLILRGGTEHVAAEVDRAVEDALNAVAAAIRDGRVVAGGGATEVDVAAGLRSYAGSVDGREQLAVEAAADAAEVLPRTLAENGGHSPVDALVALRASHDSGHRTAGIDVDTGEVVDMRTNGVLEPRRVKTHAIGAAIEAVTSVLRIDDVLSVGELSLGGGDGTGSRLD